ncbi:MAG: hypothetical protein AB1295_02935 [Candidatus Micrarchaeota archaeon]
MLRFVLISLLFAALFATGCISPPEGIPSIPTQPGGEVCRTVTEEVPVVEEQCGEVSYTEQVCEIRELGYTATELPKVDLCISDGVCNGRPLGECQGCTQAMTRCILQVTNEETQKSGTWKVSANYSLGNSGFIKDPISYTIAPGETVNFDFNQIYSPGKPISSASCLLWISSKPKAEECHEETRSRVECRDVEATKTVEREVCE